MDTTMGVTTPDRASNPLAVETTDSSDQGSLPPPSYNESNYNFDHPTPSATPYYQPTAILEQLHITEYQITATPPLDNHSHYVQLFIAFTLEEYQLLSLQRSTTTMRPRRSEVSALRLSATEHHTRRSLLFPHHKSP